VFSIGKIKKDAFRLCPTLFTGDMERKVAVITGAAQGIGLETARTLAQRGFDLALNDLKPPTATLDAAARHGIDVIEIIGDISAEEQVAAMSAAVVGRFGRVDVLVNNAGISLIRPARETTPDEWRRVLEVNLTGPFLICRAFGARMLDQKKGSIINVASIAGLLAVADRAAYCASKHGLVGLTRTLAAEWGGRGVRVNAVCPGWVKTEMDAADQAAGVYGDSDIISRVPMARFATASDVANAIAFLADDEQSAFVNGHTLSVDGGWFADASWDRLRLENR
jgi:NAD(P)-dependent dehydrogenase (short-subunit alcohol dehydrogenase family)